MSICKVKLNAISDIRDFVNAASNCENRVDAVSGRYIVDAKSLMGLFSLDLSKPVELHVHTENPKKFYDSIKSYIVA